MHENRSNIVGATFGLLCFPAVLFAGELAAGLHSAAVFFSIVLVGAAAVAGIIAAVLTSASSPADFTPPQSARIGARTGALTVLVGSGAIVAALTFHVLGVLAPNGDPAPPYYGLLASALSALPAIFGASAGAMLTTFRRRFPHPTPAPETATAAAGTEKASRKRGLLPYILLSSGICYVFPLVTLFLSQEEPVPEPVATEAPAPPVPSPRFAYEIPEGFEQADPSRLRIIAEKELEGAIVNHGVTLSPDDQVIFYCARSKRGTAMIAKRLDDFEDVAVSMVENPPRMMSWSPDSKRIFWVSGSGGDVFAVWDLATNRQIYLPIPRPSYIEGGYPVWWDDEEVVLYSEKRTTWLSLDTLEVQPLAASPKWTNDEEAFDLIRAAFPKTTAFPNLPPPETKRFNPFAMTYMSSYLPRTPSYEELRYEGKTCLALSDREKDYTQCFPQIELSEGSDLLVTEKGDKIVCLRSNRTTVCYLGLRDPVPPQVFFISIPDTEKNDPGSTAKMTSFICAPLTNPLNGKVVGPDRRRIKGVARFFPMKENNARVWVSQEIYPIQEGDILADSHMKYGRALVQSEGILGGTGWTPLAAIPSPETETIPTREESTAMHTNVEKNETASVDAASLTESSPAGLSSDENIRAFIRAHHEKASKKDLEGYVADYGARVDFFDQGIVDQGHIRKDQAGYYDDCSEISETISENIQFEEIEPDRLRASYQIQLALTKIDGEKQTKTIRATLDLDISQDSPRILRQRSETLSQEKQRAPDPASNMLRGPSSPEERIISFLRSQYEKFSKGDMRGYMDGFADRYYVAGLGWISNSTHLRTLEELKADAFKYQATIIGDIAVSRLSPDTYQAKYHVITTMTSPSKKTREDHNRTTEIQITKSGQKITRQESRTR